MEPITEWTQEILPLRIIHMIPKERIPRKKKKKELKTRFNRAKQKVIKKFISPPQYCLMFDNNGEEIEQAWNSYEEQIKLENQKLALHLKLSLPFIDHMASNPQ